LTAASRASSSALLILPAGLLAGTLAIAGAEVHPLVPIAALVVIAVLVLGVMRPMWALYGAFAAIPVSALASSLGAATVSPTELLFYAAAGGWVVRRLASGDLSIRPTPITAPFALFVFSIVPALLFAAAPVGVFKSLFTSVLIFICFLMLVSDGDENDAKRLAIILAVVAGIIGVIALLSPPDPLAQGRAQGPFGQPNTLGQWIAMPIPIAIAFIVRPPSPKIRLLMIPCVALALAALVASASRGSIIGILAMGLVYLAWRPFRYFAVIAAILFATLVVADFRPITGWADLDQLGERLTKIGEPSDEASVQRIEAYEKVPQMIIDHPIFGVGAFNFPQAAPDYDLNFPAYTSEFGNAHNTALHVAAERGLIGLGALVWFAVALGVMLWRTVQRASPELRPLAFGLAGAFAGQFLIGLFESGLPDPTIALTTFILAGCACLLHRAVVDQSGESAERGEQNRTPFARRPPVAAPAGAPS
jgi:O-antigen ligase